MKSIVKISTTAALIAAMALTSCERRALEDDYKEYALVPVQIDWSLSGVSVEQMHRASVWLFPHDESAPLQYRLEGNLTYREIRVPAGIYSVLVFNETIDKEDWNGIAFKGTDKYHTFAATSIPQKEIGFYNSSEELPLIGNPEALAAWSLDYFEVTEEMIFDTRTNLKNSAALVAKVPELTAIKPLPRFERVIVNVYVTNLASSKQVTATIDAMYSGVYMVSGKRITKPAAQAFIFNVRDYDGYDGTTTCTFNIFGKPTKANHNLNIDFLLTNNEMHPREEFDVTNLITSSTIDYVQTHVINIGYGNDNGDHEITLPKGDMNADNITVEDWDEIRIPLN